MFWKVLIVVLILLLLFGSHRLGAIGQNLGQGIRNFKKALRDRDDDEPEPDGEAETKDPKLLPAKGESTGAAEERAGSERKS